MQDFQKNFDFDFDIAHREYNWAGAQTVELNVQNGDDYISLADVQLKNMLEKNKIYGVVIRHQSNEAGVVRCSRSGKPLLSRVNMAKAHLVLKKGTTETFNAPLEHLTTEPFTNTPGDYTQILMMTGLQVNDSVIEITGGAAAPTDQCIEITFLPAHEGCNIHTTCK